tara:strand:- start:291 stop:1145 length:855 start_codon:yes stop_codon:yes gene_type:complete
MKNIDLKEFAGKDVSVLLKKADELSAGNLEGKIHAHKIYNILLDDIPNIYDEKKLHVLRGLIRQKIWICEKSFFWNENFFSQFGQDKIIKNYFFHNKKNGFFVEIGAFNGISGSNCFHFEKFLSWEGIAFEPSNIQYEKLKKNRNCHLINKALAPEEKEVEFLEVEEGYTQMSGILGEKFITEDTIKNDPRSKTNKILITTTTFEKSVPPDKDIDYLSIDIEGGEMELLDSIDFEKYSIKVISVENNSPEKINFKKFFDKLDFIYFDRVGQDEIFYNNNFFKLS